MIDEILEQGRRDGTVRAIDFHLGLFMEKLYRRSGYGSSCPELRLAATLTSIAVGDGHVCLPLGCARRVLPAANDLIPPLKEWREKLLATPLVGRPGEVAPLILDGKNRLYFHRYYKYEEIIAGKLLRRAEKSLEYDQERVTALLDSLFPDSGPEDEQKNAVAMALRKPLVIISGGPGTGKTHTVARILAAILELNDTGHENGKKNKPLKIGLTAPTGKAAARLEESIRKAKETIPASITSKEKIPEQAETLHRLLGYQPARGAFRYNSENLLYLDVVVLDEASMIDVVLMTALVEALAEKTRIILLGDHNQLTSVEAGNLFGDLCARRQRTEDRGQNGQQPKADIIITKSNKTKSCYLPLTSHSPNAKHQTILSSVLCPLSPDKNTVVHLVKSYRFHDKSGIGLLAGAVNDGDMGEVEHILDSEFSDLDYADPLGHRQGREWLRERITKGYAAMAGASSLVEGFKCVEKFRILCAVRLGRSGTEEVNRFAGQCLQREGWLESGTELYRGKPIIIRKNSYGLQLFNGDTGLLWTDERGQLMAWFKRKDNSFLSVTPARLPKYDPGFAITIHQSQGSEFEEVLLVLPDEGDSRVLSRELLYTGITRARNKLFILSRRNILLKAVSRRSERYSGLVDMMSAKGGSSI